jgi:predicted PhzF superfamily epimerase YddE/YHI9
MFQEVIKVSSMLRERKFKLNFNKTFKVTKLPKAARVYLNDIYVVADKNFNKNHEIFERFLNSKFLIVDEDLNTGSTLYNLIQALKKAIPSQSDSNIMCLTNSYSSGGM